MTAFPKPGPRPKRKPNPGHPYLGWLKTQPCSLCYQTAGIEAAHVEGPLSMKTGLPLPRRRDEAYLSALPLCGVCHERVHTLGEAAVGLLRVGRADALARLAHAYLARYTRERS